VWFTLALPLGHGAQRESRAPGPKGRKPELRADVAMDTSTDALPVRREMESMFALPLRKLHEIRDWKE
jgi:hypothetical protein